MKPNHLGRDVIWRVVICGLGGGAGLGAIYGPFSMITVALLILLGYPVGGSVSSSMVPVWLTASFIEGGVLGGLIGLLIGPVDGLLLAIITVRIVRSPRAALNYRRTLSITSSITGGLGAFVLFMWIGPPIPTYREGVPETWFQVGFSVEWFLWVVIPALIAASYGWRAGNRIASWVAHQEDTKVSPSLPLSKESGL